MGSFQEKSHPADNLPVKIRRARAADWRCGFLLVNCRPGETLLEGDPIMGHRVTAGDGHWFQHVLRRANADRSRASERACCSSRK